jgi:hypothetical protein
MVNFHIYSSKSFKRKATKKDSTEVGGCVNSAKAEHVGRLPHLILC